MMMEMMQTASASRNKISAATNPEKLPLNIFQLKNLILTFHFYLQPRIKREKLHVPYIEERSIF